MFISDDGVDVYIQCMQRKAVFGKRKFTGCFTAINFDSCRSHSDPEESFCKRRHGWPVPGVEPPFNNLVGSLVNIKEHHQAGGLMAGDVGITHLWPEGPFMHWVPPSYR
jgi:hypothetical protein